MGKLRRMIPAACPLVEHHRHDGPQFGLSRIVAAFGLPYAAAIAQKPEGHPRIGRRLMLEQHVHGNGLAALGVLDLVEKVGLASLQVLVNEGAVDQGQGRPVEAVPERGGQRCLQQAGSFAGIGEDGPEEPVMRLVDVGHVLLPPDRERAITAVVVVLDQESWPKMSQVISASRDSLIVSKQSARHNMWTEITRPQYERPNLRHASDLSDAEWDLIAPSMPPSKTLRRPRTTRLCDVVNATQYL